MPLRQKTERKPEEKKTEKKSGKVKKINEEGGKQKNRDEIRRKGEG